MSTHTPRYRLAVDAALARGAEVMLADNAAHYLTTVLRLHAGDSVALFNRTDGEWRATIHEVRKKQVVLIAQELLRAPAGDAVQLMVCFAPIKGGRMETIIEKATELGAAILQPVITARTIVDKVNLMRAESIAKEAAEQCERVNWPEIREPLKLAKLLGDWPQDIPLIYGDESGASAPVTSLAKHAPAKWAVLAGPEGGFTAEEFGLLHHVKAAQGVGLGPRILRADTAVITLCVATLQIWGDWDRPPRFISKGD